MAAQVAERTPINTKGSDLSRKVDEAWAALIAANDADEPRVMVRGNELVRLTERGELEPFGPDSLKDELSRVADFGGMTKEGGWQGKEPPTQVVKSLLARDSSEYEGAPRVDRVVDTPVVGADGSLVSQPGHHPASRLYYRPADDLANVRPAVVDHLGDLEDARTLLLDDLLGDFGFRDQASRANALGLLLLPFVREFIGDSPTPMHTIIAPERGTGKTLLAQTALLPGCGLVPMTTASRNNGDEWRKSLTASLLRGSRAIIFDNVNDALASSDLASVLTTGIWRDRILGASREVTLPVRNAWVATGNNMALSEELARRAVPIFLDPGEVNPAKRPKSEFRHPDLIGWTRANRPEYVEAALTLIQHWLDGEVVMDGAGAFDRVSSSRFATDRTLGSFEMWAEVVGGILKAADVPDFLANLDQLDAEVNEETHEVTEFLAAWHDLQMDAQTSDDLALLCGPGGILHGTAPIELTNGDVKSTRLWLRSYTARNGSRDRFGGYQLIRTDGRPKRWHVRKA